MNKVYPNQLNIRVYINSVRLSIKQDSLNKNEVE
jgi:hypothetical protein